MVGHRFSDKAWPEPTKMFIFDKQIENNWSVHSLKHVNSLPRILFILGRIGQYSGR